MTVLRGGLNRRYFILSGSDWLPWCFLEYLLVLALWEAVDRNPQFLLFRACCIIHPLVRLLCLDLFDFFIRRTIQTHFKQMFLELLGPNHSAWAVLHLFQKMECFHLFKKIGWYFLTQHMFIIVFFPWVSFHLIVFNSMRVLFASFPFFLALHLRKQVQLMEKTSLHFW